MKHGLNRTGIYMFSGFIAVRKIILWKIQKKSSLLLFVYFTISMPSLTIMALNFHSTQQVSENSLVHALIKQLKYLQIQNRCFHNWKVHLRIHCNICFSFFPSCWRGRAPVHPSTLTPSCHLPSPASRMFNS